MISEVPPNLATESTRAFMLPSVGSRPPDFSFTKASVSVLTSNGAFCAMLKMNLTLLSASASRAALLVSLLMPSMSLVIFSTSPEVFRIAPGSAMKMS